MRNNWLHKSNSPAIETWAMTLSLTNVFLPRIMRFLLKKRANSASTILLKCRSTAKTEPRKYETWQFSQNAFSTSYFAAFVSNSCVSNKSLKTDVSATWKCLCTYPPGLGVGNWQNNWHWRFTILVLRQSKSFLFALLQRLVGTFKRALSRLCTCASSDDSHCFIANRNKRNTPGSTFQI